MSYIEELFKNVNSEYDRKYRVASQMQDEARLVKDIKMFKIADEIHSVNTFAYYVYNRYYVHISPDSFTDNDDYDYDYITFLEKNSTIEGLMPYYNTNGLATAMPNIMEMLKNMLTYYKKNKELMHKDNIITDTSNKFVIIDSPNTSYSENLKTIIEYKYDFIRMCMSEKSTYIYCVDEFKNMVKMLHGYSGCGFEYSHSIFQETDKKLCNDTAINYDHKDFIVFSLDDFYNAMKGEKNPIVRCDSDYDCNYD